MLARRMQDLFDHGCKSSARYSLVSLPSTQGTWVDPYPSGELLLGETMQLSVLN